MPFEAEELEEDLVSPRLEGVARLGGILLIMIEQASSRREFGLMVGEDGQHEKLYGTELRTNEDRTLILIEVLAIILGPPCLRKLPSLASIFMISRYQLISWTSVTMY